MMQTMRRREFLILGAALGSSFFVGGLANGKPYWLRSRASAASISVPNIDRLVMTNVVDNIYDIFARGRTGPELTVQRTPFTVKPELRSEHGLAYHLETVDGQTRREVLLDFALTGESLLNNYITMKVDPSKVDALILSHGHLDHYGALPRLASLVPEWAKRGIDLYSGGFDTFCQRWSQPAPDLKIDLGRLDRDDLESKGLKIRLAEQADIVAGHAVTSGHIPRITDFETPPPGAKLEAGEPASGCQASLHFPPGTLQVETPAGELVDDIFWGEQATAYHVRNRGLVVISSCGHAGIINTVRQIQSVTGIEKVHAIVGGWHLAPYPDEVINKTVDAFKQIDPDYLIPMHCTGFNCMSAIRRVMPDKLIMPSTGTRIVFGA